MVRNFFYLVTTLFFLSVFALTTSAAAEPVIYDSVPAPLPPNVVSLGFQATSTAEFGDHIQFTGTARRLKNVTVIMSNWAIYSNYPALDPAGYDHPITFNIYAVDNSGPTPALGALLYTTTQTFLIPWRPEPDLTCSVTPGPWRASDGNCYNGYAFSITFDLSGLNTPLPDEIIYGIAYNTQTHGYSPIGVAGPYNSLNVGLSSQAPNAGTDVENDAVFWNTSHAASYADGGSGGVGTFRRDLDWSPYTPAIQFVPYSPTISPEIHNAGHNAVTSANPGDSVHVQATVSGSVGQPTGEVTLSLYQTIDCSGTATTETASLSNGLAESNATTVPATGLSYQISYAGDVTYAAATSSCVSLPVRPAITSADNATFTIGSSGSFIVNASGYPVPSLTASSGLPEGLTFTDNGNGTGTLSGIPASGTAGVYPLSFTASSGELQAVQSFTLTVDRTAAIVAIHDTPDPSQVAQAVTITFSVTAHPVGSITPTGTVTVTDSDGNSCSENVAVGSCVLVPTIAGSKVLTATYAGDLNFYGNTVTTTHEVSPQAWFLPILMKS